MLHCINTAFASRSIKQEEHNEKDLWHERRMIVLLCLSLAILILKPQYYYYALLWCERGITGCGSFTASAQTTPFNWYRRDHKLKKKKRYNWHIHQCISSASGDWCLRVVALINTNSHLTYRQIPVGLLPWPRLLIIFHSILFLPTPYASKWVALHNITSVKGLFISGFMGFDRPACKDSVRHYHQGQQLEDLKKEHIIQSRGEWEGSAIVKVTHTSCIFSAL